jgi:hypothetical protein
MVSFYVADPFGTIYFNAILKMEKASLINDKYFVSPMFINNLIIFSFVLLVITSIRWATYKSKMPGGGQGSKENGSLETSPVHVSFISYQVR